MKARLLKDSFVERFLVLSNHIVNTRSHQKIKLTIVSKRFPQRKAEMAQRMEGNCQLKMMYTLKPMQIMTVEKLCTRFLKATCSDCGIFLVKSLKMDIYPRVFAVKVFSSRFLPSLLQKENPSKPTQRIAVLTKEFVTVTIEMTSTQEKTDGCYPADTRV